MRTFYHRILHIMSHFASPPLLCSSHRFSHLFSDGKIIGWKGVENVDILAFELAPNIQVGLCHRKVNLIIEYHGMQSDAML